MKKMLLALLVPIVMLFSFPSFALWMPGAVGDVFADATWHTVQAEAELIKATDKTTDNIKTANYSTGDITWQGRMCGCDLVGDEIPEAAGVRQDGDYTGDWFDHRSLFEVGWRSDHSA